MTNRPYKLLVSDIDGTLIDKNGNISPQTNDAIALAQQAGITVSLSTGRAITSTLRYIRELELDNFHIFFDGALVSRPSTGERIVARFIDPVVVREMVLFSDEKRIDLELFTTSNAYSARETWSTDVKARFFEEETTIGDLNGIWEHEEIIRAQIATKIEDKRLRIAEFDGHFHDCLDYVIAGSPAYPEAAFINIIAKGVSKGSALKTLAAHIGLRPEEVVAVGDWINDISLLSAAGLSIAMGNAVDELKQVADHITLDVEEHGLAKAIHEFILT